VTASALVKDLRIGRYRVKPPAVASPSAIEPGKLDLNFNFSLAGPEWGLAFSRLGTTSAFFDLVITDKFIHAYFYRSRTTRHIRNELPLVTRPAPAGETPRGSYQISPASAVLEPVDDEKGLELFALTEQWHPQEHRSPELRWASHFQKMRIHCIDDLWSWDFQWVTSYPTFEKNLWHATYQSAFAEVIPLCDKLGINHLIVSPDGSLNAMPLHLLPDDEGTRLGTKIAISYLPNVTGILNILDVDNLSFDNVSFIVVTDPTRTVGMAEWECQSVASIAGRRAQIIPSHEATVARIKELSQGAGVLHFTGHATFTWTDPDSAYLTAAGNERMGLADLRELRFQPGALVFLSACHSGRHSMGGERSASRGIVSALLEAGVASVVCTLWPIDSPAAALVAYWFYEALIRERKARLESLQQATKKLREATRSECEQILGRRIFRRGERPFEDEYYWGAYVLYGAW
jgi:CHAT domain-containing protein